MDDREIAKILRRRNVEYVRHLNKTSPHLESHDQLEGGFFSAVAAAARIAARAAAKAVATAAKAAAKAGSQAAKAAAKTAKAAAKAAKAGAKSAAKTARSGSKLDKLDKAMTAADLAQTSYNVAKIAMEKTKEGEELTQDEWEDLSPNQQVMIDFQRWARGLDRADYDLFKSRGGDKSAAMQVVRLMQAGLDPDDWVGNAIDTRVEGIADQIEEIDDTNPADDDECLNKLDEDDRSQAERIGLEFAAIGDMGISQALSERDLEQRQRQRYNFCVEQKTKQLKATRDGLMSRLGLGPNAAFDIENMQVRQHVMDSLAAENPIMKLALELDAYREMNGLPKIDPEGAVLKDPDSIANDNCEKIAAYFVKNKTTEYADQPWILELLKNDPTIVNRAISRMPYIDYFCSSTPEVTAFKTEYVSTTIPLTADQIAWNNNYNNAKEQYTKGKQYWTGNVALYDGKVFYVNANANNAPGGHIVPWTDVPDPVYWREIFYVNPEVNKEGIKKAQDVSTWLKSIKETVDNAAEAVQLYDDKEAAQRVTAVFNPAIDYNVGDAVRYANKVYKCTTAQRRGYDRPQPGNWDELSLYNEDDFDALKNIGSATEWVEYKAYPVDTYVTYAAIPNSIWVKIKESPAGTKPDGPEKVWEQIIINNGDLLDLQTNPAREWSAARDYKIDDVVFWKVDLQTYKAIAASKNVKPDDTKYWRQLITFNLDDELVKRLKIEQRAAIFASAVEVAQDFDPDEIYELHDIVCGFDGNYYELIKEKRDKDGDVLAPPLPPNTTYWKLISDGVTVFDPKKQYAINDFVLYEKVYYICTKANTPIGTLPTDVNYWELLDPIFEDLDPEVVAQNTERLYDAIINRSEEYQDDETASYQIGDIIKIFDNDGYPQFYECIKDLPVAARASDANIRKAEPYNNGKLYTTEDIVLKDGVLYTAKPGIARGYPPPDETRWDVLGYEKDPGPPNPEFWKDYTAADTADEKLEKIRDTAVIGNQDAEGIFVGDIVKDPLTDLYYKLVLNPDKMNEWPINNNEDFGTAAFYLNQVGKGFQKLPGESDKDAVKRAIATNYNNNASWRPGFNMIDLPEFDNTKRSSARQPSDNVPQALIWEPETDIPSEEASKIKNIETKAIWRRDKLYKRGELVIDKYKIKYSCVKDTPEPGMEPFYNQPEYFIELDEREWDDAIQNERYQIEDETELSHQYDDILFHLSDKDKPREWGEIVRYKDKFYKFFAFYQEPDKNSPTVPRQREPGKLNDSYLEWNECDAFGKLLVVDMAKDYPGVNPLYVFILMYMKGGPILKIADKYFVYNGCYKEIFGLGGPDEKFTNDWYGFWNNFANTQGPEDTFKTEVFQDGKPVFKHDANGNIIGKNTDVSGVPPAEAKAIETITEKAKTKTECPTLDDEDDDEEDDHHEKVQAEKELEQAMIHWRATGSKPEDNPMLLQGQKPEEGPIEGLGINIEELDGSKYHKKSKVRKSKKNKI